MSKEDTSYSLRDEMQESLTEWGNIDKQIEERKQKDQRIIDKFYAKNKVADLVTTLKMMQNLGGMRPSNKKFLEDFEVKIINDTPEVRDLVSYEDLYDLFKDQLKESGGC